MVCLSSFLQYVDPFGGEQDMQKLNTNIDVIQQLLLVCLRAWGACRSGEQEASKKPEFFVFVAKDRP